jgi:hypothetical protein
MLQEMQPKVFHVAKFLKQKGRKWKGASQHMVWVFHAWFTTIDHLFYKIPSDFDKKLPISDDMQLN